jgi:hypothetical protein
VSSANDREDLTVVDILQRMGKSEYGACANGNAENETADALQPGTAAEFFPPKICFQGLYPFID